MECVGLSQHLRAWNSRNQAESISLIPFSSKYLLILLLNWSSLITRILEPITHIYLCTFLNSRQLSPHSNSGYSFTSPRSDKDTTRQEPQKFPSTFAKFFLLNPSLSRPFLIKFLLDRVASDCSRSNVRSGLSNWTKFSTENLANHPDEKDSKRG